TRWTSRALGGAVVVPLVMMGTAAAASASLATPSAPTTVAAPSVQGPALPPLTPATKAQNMQEKLASRASSEAASPNSTFGCSYVPPYDQPQLSYGSTGAAVKQVQCLINNGSSYPYYISVDGDFGTATQAGVYYVQSCNGITVDGIVGPETWYYLYNPMPQCAL
ncbi:MAG: peptidoglycan-binding domain-containing protein, partial [Acidimicrobiales bacterium]